MLISKRVVELLSVKEGVRGRADSLQAEEVGVNEADKADSAVEQAQLQGDVRERAGEDSRESHGNELEEDEVKGHDGLGIVV